MSNILIKQLILIINNDGIYLSVDPAQPALANLVDVRDELCRRGITNADFAQIENVILHGNDQPTLVCESPRKYDQEKDKYVQVRVSDEGVHAYLTVRFPDDPELSTSEWDINHKLWEANIRLPIDKDKIKNIVQKRETIVNEIVCTGIPPVHGIDGRVEHKVEVGKKKAPLIRVDGSVDHHQLNHINCVRKSQHLAHLVPPTEGKPGINVFDEPIPCKPGRKVRMPRGINTYISPDELDLYAKYSGILYQENGLLNIEPIYVVPKDVDFSTGDIHYTGDIIVSGDIKTGFTVETDGNILVRGSVDGAVVKSNSGRIVINGGILGKYKAVIEAQQNITAEFAQHAKIVSRNDVEIRKYLLDCEIEAYGFVKIPKGQIIGGTVSSERGIIAHEIGTSKNVRTQIAIGRSIDTNVWMEILQLNKKIKDLKREFDSINEQISFLEVLEKRLNNLNDKKQKELEELLLRRDAIQNRIDELEKEKKTKTKTGDNSFDEFPSVQANYKIYPGVVLQMNQFVEEVSDQLGAIRISLKPTGVEKKVLA